ncbi:MAG: hypothetical protein OXC72_02310, partial [Roseovarius sp.]|nr:hypothetical protein [Roseovarius sp.]
RGVAFPDWETLYRALAGEVEFVLVRDGPWRQRRLRASVTRSNPQPRQNRSKPPRTAAPDSRPCAPETREPPCRLKKGSNAASGNCWQINVYGC